MRTLTLISWLMVLVVCTALFNIKQEVGQLHQELRMVRGSILETQQSLHLLHAEWAHLTRPAYLTAMSARYLTLTPMQASQMANAGQLPANQGQPETVPAVLASATISDNSY